MPHYPSDNEGIYYYPDTLTEKHIHDYCGMSFEKIANLSLSTYLQLRRDAFIYRMNATPEGREYLEKCWILEQQKPDKKALREQFGGEIIGG